MSVRRSLVNAAAHHQLLTASDEVTTTLAIAFVDFTKAYNSISREALWEVLKLYRVHPHVILSLEYLHTGTEAVVRVDGEVGRSFTEALSHLPPDKQFGVQIIIKSGVELRCGRWPRGTLKLRLGHRNIKDFSGMYSSAIRGCHEERVFRRRHHFLGLPQVAWPH
eukprot:360885-Chlamydomonas_euryale.AAC.3